MSDDLDLEDTSEEEPEETPKPAPRKSMRPKRGVGNAGALPAAVGVAPGAPAPFRRQASEADAVWNELVAWLPSAGLTPRDIAIQVRRVAPPAPSGEPLPIGRAFGGEMVSGNNTEPPGSALVQFVMRYMHMPLTQTPASYDLMFMRKATGAQLATGRLALPSAQDCQAMLQAGEQAGLGALGAPPQQMWQPPPMYPQPPAGMAGQPWGYPVQSGPYPQTYPSAQFGPAPQGFAGPDQGVMSELAAMRGALSEALAAAREGRQPNIPGMTPPAAPTGTGGLTDLDVDRIAARVATMMGAARAVPPPPAPIPTVAAPPPDSSLEGMMRTAVAGMTKRIFDTALGSVEKSVTRSIGIGGLPGGSEDDGDEERPAPAEIIPPEKPEDMVPWKVGDVGANWSNGSPVKIAMNKETGKLDPMGLAFANPAVAEKLIDVANGLGMALQDAIKNFGAKPGVGAPPQPSPHVVHSIPAGAVDATVGASDDTPQAIPDGWQAP